MPVASVRAAMAAYAGALAPFAAAVQRHPELGMSQRLGASPRFTDVEWGCYSQNTEDGILDWIFAIIGTKSKRAVEMCSGVGYENNVASLVLFHGWEALLLDGSDKMSSQSSAFFAQPGMAALAGMGKAHSLQAFITRDGTGKYAGVNGLVSGKNGPAGFGGFKGEIDLYSLDMDGMDWWIWEKLTVVTPRVVVVEIQELWGPWERKTRPYVCSPPCSPPASPPASPPN